MQNPQTPNYAQPAPLPNENCLGCGNKPFVYPPLVAGNGGSGKNVEVDAGYAIAVQDNSDSDTFRFKVSSAPQSALSVILSLVVKAAGVVKAQPILLGTIIDEWLPTWSYNRAVASQNLAIEVQNIDQGGDIPSLSSAARTADVNSNVSITDDATVTINGDDGSGNPGSTADATAQIQFANVVAWGDYTDLISSNVSDLQAIFDGMNTSVQRTRGKTLYATGGANRHFYYFVPKRYGLVTFQKGIFIGGFIRLKNDSGVLVDDLGTDTESDILLTNSLGFQEAYYVYESEYDNQNDPVTPIIAS